MTNKKNYSLLAILPLLMSCALYFSLHPQIKPNTLTNQEIENKWKLLFDGETSKGWKSTRGENFPDNGWVIKYGVLTVLAGKKGGDIVTVDQFSSFELSLEFKLAPGANSGIKYFVQPGTSLGLEYQILDDDKHLDAKKGVRGNRSVASLYDLIPAENKKTNSIGEWNRARILVKGNHVEHWLNGVKVVEYERGTQLFRALIAKSKYKDIPNFGLHERGHILLQDHGENDVSFRNIKIRLFE